MDGGEKLAKKNQTENHSNPENSKKEEVIPRIKGC